MDFIAEIGWNFIGDMHLAQRMIESASGSGATIAKFQLWNPKTLKSGAWDHDGRRDIYKKAALDPTISTLPELITPTEQNKPTKCYSTSTH